MPLGAQLPSCSCIQEAIAFVHSSMICESANKNVLESVGISWNIREGPWSGGSTRYVWKFNAAIHPLILYTFNDLDCLWLLYHQSYCHPHSLFTLMVSHMFLCLTLTVTIQLHHDITSQQYCPSSAMPQPTPDAIFGAHLNPLTSLSQHSLLSHKQPTHHTHLQLSPFHHHNWHPHCQPFKSEVSSTWNYLTIPPHTIPTSCSNLSTWSYSSCLPPDSCTLPHTTLEDLVNLRKWKARFSFESSFLYPSILHLMQILLPAILWALHEFKAYWQNKNIQPMWYSRGLGPWAENPLNQVQG